MNHSGSDTKLRILHIGKFFPPHRGGMETYLSDLVKAQRDSGVDARVLVHGRPCEADADWLYRVPVQFQMSFAPVALGFPVALRRILKMFKPHALHIHMPNNAVLWLLLGSDAQRLPWVVHWHSDVLDERMPVWIRALLGVYRVLEQTVLDRACSIVATSPPYLAASTSLAPWCHKCVVVPLGLAPVWPVGEAFSSSMPLPWRGKALRLLAIGRMTYYKNFGTLIEAVAGQPGLELVLVGDGEMLAPWQVLADRLSGVERRNVHFLGNVDDESKNALLAGCEVFCLPSMERTEAFGMVLLEAMLHSKPCVVSSLPGSGMPWVVESAGCGWAHLPANDAAAWRSFLNELALQPDEMVVRGARGHRAFVDRFSASAGSRALARVYQAAIQLPLHPVNGVCPQKDSTLIVIPAKDEAATLPSVLSALQAHGWPHVLVVDDSSSDDTGALARKGGAMVAAPLLPLGAWGGMQLGIRWAHARGFVRVITMDADGQHEVDELPALLAAAAHADTVIGAFPERASRLRRFAWRWFQWLTGLNVTDLTSGFRCYNHKAIAVLAGGSATQLDYQDVGTLLLLRKAGLTVMEVPVSMNARVVGVSRIFRSWALVARYMMVTTLLCVMR